MDLLISFLSIATGLFATGRPVEKLGLPATIALVPVVMAY
jgi:AAA family ATP:ADP antiporter